MRIVSLLPSATEIVFAIGLGRSLVGVSHDSDWPEEARSRPVVTRPALRRVTRVPSADAGERDRAAEGEPPADPHEGTGGRSFGLVLDEGALGELRPDLVIGPPAREVDVPIEGSLPAAIQALDEDVALLQLDPVSVEGIFNSISAIGAMTGAEAPALRVVERLRARLGRIERRVQRRRDQGRRPTRAVALERLDPPFTTGRWVPEQIRRAGGWDLLGRETERPSETTWEAVRDVDPETVVLMPRGLHLAEAVAAWVALPRPDWWAALDAARRGQLFAVDGAAYFERPGPRFVDGIALLAEIMDPDGFVEASPIGSWTPVD